VSQTQDVPARLFTSSVPSPSRRRLSLAILAMLAAVVAMPAGAQTGVTGTWTGIYNYSITPSGCNKTITSTGNVTVTFLQVDSTLSGTTILSDLQIFTAACTTTKQDFGTSLTGSITGTNVSWGLLNDADVTQFTGTRSGEVINATIADNSGGTGTLTLTRSGAPAAVDTTGSWNGSYNLTDRCSNGGTQNYSGALTLSATQSGTPFDGVMTMTNVPLYDQNCQKILSETLALSTAGSVNASTLTGAVFEPAGSFELPVTIAVNGATMTGTVGGANLTSTTGTFTLSRSSSQKPDATYTGTYSGTYAETDNTAPFCFNIGSLSFDGPATLALLQSGNGVSGTLTIDNAQSITQNGFGACGVVNLGELTLPIYGTLSGGSLTVVVPQGGGVVNNYSLTFDATKAAGSITDSYGDRLTFSAPKNLTAPAITSFTASPSSIVAGQAVTLTWTTTDATSVTIDHVAGSQAASGSITVTPLETTTYTLTATGTGASTTAQTTVTVFPLSARRRAAG
jgi:hypothetical protein